MGEGLDKGVEHQSLPRKCGDGPCSVGHFLTIYAPAPYMRGWAVQTQRRYRILSIRPASAGDKPDRLRARG
jgi:hypothetical protein